MARLVGGAPAWMRALASDQLHIGGFTNVQLAVPVLDVSALTGGPEAERALVFFIAAALLGGAAVARVQCGRGPLGAALARTAKRRLRGLALRVEDENLGLMRYFDVHLAPPSEVGKRAGLQLMRALQAAIEHD